MVVFQNKFSKSFEDFDKERWAEHFKIAYLLICLLRELKFIRIIK